MITTNIIIAAADVAASIGGGCMFIARLIASNGSNDRWYNLLFNLFLSLFLLSLINIVVKGISVFFNRKFFIIIHVN